MSKPSSNPSDATILWLQFYTDKSVYNIGDIVKIIGEFQTSSEDFPIEITMTYPDGKQETFEDTGARTRNAQNDVTSNDFVNLTDSGDFPSGTYTLLGTVDFGQCIPPTRTTSFIVQ